MTEVSKTIPLISFFTGGGFLDLGFERAGFDITWTNESNRNFAEIYSHGMSSWRKSLRSRKKRAEISSTELIQDLRPEYVLDNAFPGGVPNIFGVIGGPPCTDFSIGGRNRGHEGKAGSLTSVYVDMLIRLKSSFFVIENVPNLLSNSKHKQRFDQQLGRLNRNGYLTKVKVLNALDYGVPQDRRRVFVFGIRKQLLSKWYSCEIGLKKAFEENFRWPLVTYSNAKKMFDWPRHANFGGKPRKPNCIPLELCVWSAVRNKPNPESLPNGLDFFNAYSVKFTERSEGDVSAKSFKRLHRYRYSPTCWYGNNEVHLHPYKKRRLSVREALRLQSVPDSYVMPENVPLSAKFKVIGNGVPCLLSEKLASTIMSFIRSSENRTNKPTKRRPILK